MKFNTRICLLFCFYLMSSQASFSQCEISSRVSPDGAMLYSMEDVNFYWTPEKSLRGNVVTDKEHYFLALYPIPFPAKPLGNKLKEDLTLILSNDSIYILDHYDTRYIEKDTVIEFLFLIDKDEVSDLLKYEAKEVIIDMGKEEEVRKYVFKLHKAAIKEQLECFLKEAESEKR